MRSRHRPCLLLFAASLVGAGGARAADGGGDFSRGVAPVLVQKCLGCHGPDRAKGHYRLDTFERLMKPGDGGTAPVVPGEPEKSEMVRRITSHDPKTRMPQKDDPLPTEQVAAIEAWVRAGATFDGRDRTAPLATLVPSAAQPHPAAPAAYPRPVPVLALAFAPDGKSLAAGGYHELTFWSANDGRLLRRVGDQPRQAHAIAFSPDGSLLAVAGGSPGGSGELRLVTPDDFPGAVAPARVLERTADVMPCAAFSPDGTRLAAGGADGAVRLYDVATGKLLRRVEEHADWVTAVAFSPDGTRLASASRDKSVRVIDARTGESQSAYLGHEAVVLAVAWAADGKLVYSGGKDREVHAWEPAAEGKKLAEAGGFGGDVLRLAAGADGVFASAAGGTVRKLAPRDGKELRVLQTFDCGGEWAYALAFDKNTGRLAVGGFDGAVRVFSGDGKLLTTFVAAPGYSPPARTPSTITPSSPSGG